MTALLFVAIFWGLVAAGVLAFMWIGGHWR